jgi:hypothetical protein
MLQVVSIFPETRVTSNEHLVHCTSKFWWSSWRGYFPNTFFQNVFSTTITPFSLPFNIPHKKLTCVQIRWKGRSKSPTDYSVPTKKTQRPVGCVCTKSVKYFLIKLMSSSRTLPVWNVTCSPKPSRVFANLLLFGANFLWTYYTTFCCTVFG